MFRPVQADFLMTHVVVQQSSAIEQHARCVKTSSDAESSLDELLENKENTNILSADMIQRLVDNLSVESRHAEESQETAHAHHAHVSGLVDMLCFKETTLDFLHAHIRSIRTTRFIPGRKDLFLVGIRSLVVVLIEEGDCM